MAKYHISPTTGRPNQCHARKQCPFGGEEKHYDSKEEARAGYEDAMKAQTVAPAAKKSAVPAEDPQDIKTWQPVTVDTKLAELYGVAAKLQQRLDSDREFLAREVARTYYNLPGFRATSSPAQVGEAFEAMEVKPAEELTLAEKKLLRRKETTDELRDRAVAARKAMEPYDEEFSRRGGWNRAFLVSNGNGHVHKTMNCSTCHPTTQYHWVTEYSDSSEGDIVEAAGERACTVCYPSAPVDTRNRPTTMFTPDEKDREKARIERAAAAEVKKKEKIAKALTPDGSEFKIDYTRNGHRDRESFKTERSAVSWVVSQQLDYGKGFMKDQEPDASLVAEQERIMEAVAAKHDISMDEVRKDIARKLAAREKTWDREVAQWKR